MCLALEWSAAPGKTPGADFFYNSKKDVVPATSKFFIPYLVKLVLVSSPTEHRTQDKLIRPYLNQALRF